MYVVNPTIQVSWFDALYSAILEKKANNSFASMTHKHDLLIFIRATRYEPRSGTRQKEQQLLGEIVRFFPENARGQVIPNQAVYTAHL